MFRIGDLIVYSVHGLCKIDDIYERTFSGVTQTYYVFHPMDDSTLSISIPVESNKVFLLDTLKKEEAETIIQSFASPGIEWVDDVKQRLKKYNDLVRKGDRKEIANIANTLMRKTRDTDENKASLNEHDRKLLSDIQHVLFQELATALNTSVKEIDIKVHNMIHQHG